MPNHCYNTITLVGAKRTDEDKVLEAIKGENGPIDFNAVVPMPKEYQGTPEDFNRHPNPKGEKTDTCGVPESLGAELRKKYGAGNWYDWSIKNWGTKWNAYDIGKLFRKDGSEALPSFLTAWSPPEAFYLALSLRFPTLTFKCFYDIELGNGKGYMVFKNGEKTIDHEEENSDSIELDDDPDLCECDRCQSGDVRHCPDCEDDAESKKDCPTCDGEGAISRETE